MIWSLIYLDTHDSGFFNEWTYYRVTNVGNSTIQICEVAFPSFADKGAVIDTPGVVGLNAAYVHKEKLLEKQFGVNQDKAILIGSIIKE